MTISLTDPLRQSGHITARRMTKQPQRIEFLDGIRGIAALSVLLGHSFTSFKWHPAIVKFFDLPLAHMPFDGKAAVAMFFVLSGFVLSRPYCVSTHPGSPARKLFWPGFYARRVTRIWLPWFFVFCLSALAQSFCFKSWPTTPAPTPWFSQSWHVPLTMDHFWQQCVFAIENPVIQLVSQDWSLGIELTASALLPFLLFLATLRPFHWWWLVGVLILMVAIMSKGHFYGSFIMGVLLARYGDGLKEWLGPKPLFVKGWLLFAGVLLYNANHFGVETHYFNLFCEKLFWLGTSAGCILILVASMASKRIQAALHLPPVIFLGRISYSVYLLQMIVILCVLPPWVHLLNAWGISSTIWLLPLTLTASVAVTVGMSALTYRWIEVPCIDLGHKLSKRLLLSVSLKKTQSPVKV